jgi:hypothetical protein
MDEGTPGVNKPDQKGDLPPEKKAEQLEEDIEQIRDTLGDLVGELDHRRHRAFNVGLQIRRHAWTLAIGAGVIVAAAVGGVMLKRLRQRRRATVSNRLRRLAERMSPKARRKEKEKEAAMASLKNAPIPRQVLAAAATAVASVLARRIAEGMSRDPKSKSAPTTPAPI